MTAPLLDVQDLRTHFHTRRGVVKAVDGVSFTLQPGEALGLVGESGSGKSITCLSLVRLVPQPAGRIAGGRMLFQGEDLLTKSESEMRDIRGRLMAMVLQDPMTSLDPVFTIRNQVAEPMIYHHTVTEGNGGVAGRVLDLLRLVHIPSPELRMRGYPHQLSGGMKQRVATAIGLACEARLLIADEITTALDVTIQAQILRLLKEIQEREGVGIILVSHDLGVVARVCDRVAVMYAGRIVEMGVTRRLFSAPAHPYTAGLMSSIPRIGASRSRLYSIEGEPPDLLNLPAGCSFAPRCPHATPRCWEEYPPTVTLDDGEQVSCWLAVDGKRASDL